MLDFAKNKSFWENVKLSDDFAQHRDDVLALYKDAFKVEPRAHSYKDILENDDKGLWHLQFEQLQTSALLSLIYPENKEYYDNLLKIVWAYLDEYSWAPLGHFTEHYYGKTPADFDNGLIDIFASSVGFALAEVKNLFEDRFPSLLKDRISHELRRHIIDPYLNRKFFWETHDNNWTAVCTGGVASVLIYEAPELFFENQERIHKSMKCYLDSYKDDGMCVEGPGYWSFGFGFFSAYAMLERELTNGEVDWFKDEKIKEIAKFLQKVFLDKDVIITFSDCSVKQDYHIGLPEMLRHIYGDMIEPLPKSCGSIARGNTHFNFILRAFLYHNEDNFSDTLRRDVTYTAKDSCYLIKREKGYSLATKGGNNGESHNHIDVGTFILSRNNKQIIADIGAGPYVDGYHSDKRYTFFHPSAYAHSIPIIDGVPEDGIARDDAIVVFDEKTNSASVEFAQAYGKDFIKSVKREFKFDSYSLTLTDTFELDSKGEITERLISLIEPKIENGKIVIDDTELLAENGLMPEITVKVVDPHVGSLKPHPVYIIDYKLEKGSSFTLNFNMPND